MKFQKINVCVIEDEAPTRKVLSAVINNSLDMQVSCQADSLESAVETIMTHRPDLIFLDIKIIGGDAFMVLDTLRRRKYPIPPIVINTGYTHFEYAQKFFNHYKDEVLMILKKPFWENWEKSEKEILSKYYKSKAITNNSITKDKLIVKTNHNTHIINHDDILFIEISKTNKGKGKTDITTKTETICLSKTLNSLAKELPEYFIRINRFMIVNGQCISRYDNFDSTIHLHDIEKDFGVSDTYKNNLTNYLGRM